MLLNWYDIAILVLVFFAGGWDLLVLLKWGEESGYTLSWFLYSESRKQPIVAFLAGVLIHWLTSHSSYQALAYALWGISGHIWGTMRGA